MALASYAGEGQLLPVGASSSASHKSSTWQLSGHEAAVLGAAKWSDHPSIFATSDAAGKCFVWEYGITEEGEVNQDDEMYFAVEKAPCRSIALCSSDGPPVCDLCFLSGKPLLVGVQGDNEANIWDITRGTRLQGVHRRQQSSRGTYSSYTTAWPVLNSVDTVFAGGTSFCYAGDDGYLVLYDVRSGKVEMQHKSTGMPLTVVTCAGESRREQVYVGDACGTVQWLDLRGGNASSLLAEVWLGKKLISDIVVHTPGHHLSPPQHTEACAIALSSTSRSTGEDVEATWLNMKPFVTDEQERIQSVLPIASSTTPPPGKLSEETPAALPAGCRPFWRGDTVGANLVLPSLSSVSSIFPSAQVVHAFDSGKSEFGAGAWKHLSPKMRKTDEAAGESSRSDRRVTLVVGPTATAQGTSPSKGEPHQVVSAHGANVVLFENCF